MKPINQPTIEAALELLKGHKNNMGSKAMSLRFSILEDSLKSSEPEHCDRCGETDKEIHNCNTESINQVVEATARPWYCDLVQIKTASDRVILDTYLEGDAELNEAEANCALIVRSVNLLDALTVVEESARNLINIMGWVPDGIHDEKHALKSSLSKLSELKKSLNL